MAREVWGTFSVRDHLEPQAFVAEAMLYDRLVVPIPDSTEEESRWNEQGWRPDLLRETLSVLGERAYTVKWDAAKRSAWKERYNAGMAFAEHVPDWAFAATRTELTAGLPRYITGIEAVTAYRSLDELEKDVGLSAVPEPSIHGGAMTAIIGFEFLVPHAPGAPQAELLGQAVEISSEKAARQKRRSYWRWQREFLSDEGLTDLSSIEAAAEEMADLLEDERAAVRRAGIKTTSQYGFFLGSLTLGMFGGPLTPIGVGCAFLSLGQFAAERILQRLGSPEPSPAALLLDTRKRFGWE